MMKNNLLTRLEYNIRNKKQINIIGTRLAERGFLFKDKRFLYVALDDASAYNLQKQLTSFGNRCEVLTKTMSDVVYAPFDSTDIMYALSRYLNGEIDSIIVTYNVLLQRLPDISSIHKSILNITLGQEIDVTELSHRLTLCGYKRKALIETVGDYVIKGDIIDIHTPGKIYRVDAGFDNVESISEVSLEDNKNKQRLDNITLYPITLFLEGSGADINIVDCEYIKDNITTFFDTIILDEPNLIKDRLEQSYNESISNIKNQIQNNLATKKHLNLYTKDWFNLQDKCIISICNINNNSLYQPQDIITIDTFGVNNYAYNFQLLISDLKYYLNIGYNIILYTGTDTRAERYEKLLADNDLLYKGSTLLISPEYLHLSVALPEEKLLLISTDNLFPKKKAPTKTTSRVFYLPKVGDYVVHETHGIGICREIKPINFGIGEKDYFVIEYQKGAMLYLPSEQVSEISQYLGGDEPKLNELGSEQFLRAKKRAKESLKKLAFDLRKVYQLRNQAKGFKYSEDDEMMKAFEDAFPYELTTDQQNAVNEIKQDMQSGKVMDRLLCGDVGYGKTEVALICAYKHILDGKQVAFLAPTTILSMQHYNTVCSRMAPFMVNVAVLNRFTSSKEVARIKQGIANKTIDMVIGTHKLLGKDIKWNDLGLLILDEEQRFGVNHKEQLKSKKDLNVLTLSATPIPRTLHMSLSGIRDISIIATPPYGRLPVNTIVTQESDTIILDACQREFNRGGQVLIINDKVQTLPTVAKRLKDLLGVDIEIAHGQMDKKTLENTMLKMYNGEASILLATSLIENGIDLPKANTLIVLNSDRFGLSQAYQMRGRVGRSREQAYTYFTYKNAFLLSDIAIKRLDALREFNELGSGFKIAMRDLELRGAGTILGAEQSGHMEKIGYDLYQRLLQEVIDEMDGKEESKSNMVKINISKPAILSADYIQSETERIKVYNEIASIKTKEEAEEELVTIKQRYGDAPKEVETLIFVSLIRNLANRANIKSITISDDANIVFYDIESMEYALQFLKHNDIKPSLTNLSLRVFSNKKASIEEIILTFLIKISNKCC